MKNDEALLIALKKKSDDSAAYFNHRINLRSRIIHTNEDIIELPLPKTQQTLKIMQDQQLLSRMRVIISSSLATHKAKLSARPTVKDKRLCDSPQLTLKQIRQKTLQQKLLRPLKLRQNITEKKLRRSIKGIKNLISSFSKKIIRGINAKNLPLYAQNKSVPQTAQLLLNQENLSSEQRHLITLKHPQNTINSPTEDHPFRES